jgi:dUTP pyrophosphatase
MSEELLVKFKDEYVKEHLYDHGCALKYQSPGSSGFDLRANEIYMDKNKRKELTLEESYVLKSKERCLIFTGIFTQFNENFEIQIRSRSGLALKNGIIVLNSPGTIDSDYTNEIGVILYNTSNEDFTISFGDRIAQAVFAPICKAKFVYVSELSETERTGGFGSTGKQ